MKKQLLFLFFALLALCASAEPNDVFSVGDITYSVILDSYSGKPGIVSVKSLSAQGKAKTSLKLDIPGVVYYNGYKYQVRVIDRDAFKGQSNISVVQIRYNINRIWQSAFENCTSLTTVYMPSSLTNVGYRAFGGCTALRSVYYANATPSSTSVEPGSFPWNSGMTLYVSKAHPNSKENARKVTAFDYFSTIKKHVYASDFILVGHGYFCVTKAPASDGTTRGEMSLVGVYADDDFNNSWSGTYNNGIADFDMVEIADSACLDNTNIKNVNLTGYSKLRRVGKSAFNGCTALSSVTLNSSLLKIGSFAFRNCRALTSINLPASVEECSTHFVDGCSNLQTIFVNGSNNYFSSYMGILYNKAMTELIRCPEGYKLITMMRHDSFPAAFKTIGPYAFENCKLIKEIYLPYGTTGFGWGAFNQCTALTAIQIPRTLKDWGKYAFSGTTALDKMYVSFSEVPSLPADYFKDCKKGTLYRAGDMILDYGSEPWNSWRNKAWGGFDFIAESNFYLNSSMRYTIISDKQETVHGKQFDGEAAVTYVPDPAVTGSSEIVVPAYITLRNGKKYAVTVIGIRVCGDGMKAKATLTLGEHVEYIKNWAFIGANNLIGLNLNANLLDIGEYAFSNCNIANDIILPYGFRRIQEYAFNNNSFKRIRIPSSIRSIYSTALKNNGYLQEIILNSSIFSNEQKWEFDFTGIPSSCKLYVPEGAYSSYWSNQYWGKFTIDEGAYDFTFKNIDDKSTYYHITVTKDSTFTKDGVTYSGTAKYVYHPSHSNLSISNFIASNSESDVTHGANKKYLMTEFDDYALLNCPQITSINIKDMKALKCIGRSAFQNTSIEKFTVPSCCERIERSAFVDCKKLTELFIEDKNLYMYDRFYGNNAANFVCYVPKEKYSIWARSISKWTQFEGETVKLVDRLNAYLLINDNSTVVPFSVDHPVDWDASGLNAYTIYSYQKSEQMAYAQQVAATPAGTGLLIDGYSKGVIYKLQRPKATPPMPTNLLVGNPNEVVDVFDQSVGFLFDSSGKSFWKPTSSYSLSKGLAYLQLSPTLAGSTTRINIDLWAKATGDINGDGEVNVSDVTALINKILGSSTYSDAVCDINGDGEINVSDVTALINLILE